MNNLAMRKKQAPQKETIKKDFNINLNGIGNVLAAIIPVYFFIILEYIHFSSFANMAVFIKKYPGSAAFSLLTLYGIYAILYLILKRAFLPTFIMTLLCSLLAVSNYFKHTLTGEFIYPWDLVNQTGNVAELAGFVKIGLPPGTILTIAAGILLTAVLFFAHTRLKLSARCRFLTAAAVAAAMFVSVCTPGQTARTLSVFNMSLNDISNQEMNHSAHGFTGGFLVNLLSMNVPAPSGYSNDTIKSIIAPYSGEKAGESFSEPDIIVILSESFWNPKLFPETEFSQNPTENFDSIAKRENARSGYMYETTYGGGTVKTEFDVITGLTIDQLPAGSVPWQYITKDIVSYPSHYRNLGYRTVFLHTYEPTFYMRNKAYPYVGFDEMYFQDELTAIEDVEWHTSGNYISDDSFVSYIEYLLEQDCDKPCFMFGISMENHQPYENKYTETDIKITKSAFSDSTKQAVENYTNGVYMADLALKKLVDYIDAREKDTILVYFGDHLPSLGTDKAAYKESGFISSGEMTDDEWHSILRTPFLIYSNFRTNDSEMLTQSTENEIAACNLINAASDLIGAPKSGLMEFLTDYYKQIPFYNYRLRITPNEEQSYFIEAHKLLTYDIVNGKQYCFDN